MKPMVAVVGRPNVGKSTLFNKIAGRRISIVEDTPGITRDRIYTDAEWCGTSFTLVDTGGIEPSGKDLILKEMCVQAQLAIDMADVIVFIVNIRDGVTAADMEVAAMLQKSGKPVVVACNKVDAPGEVPVALYEFYNLGLGEPIPVSSLHGMGVGDLLDEIIALLPPTEQEEEDNGEIKVAVIGKPNAGKSSLVNKILGENRMIVSNIAGTTRDAVDSHFEKDGTHYVLIDTAGIRKRSKIDETVEKYSVIRALAALERSDVAVIMIDASEGVTEQDAKIAGYAHEGGKGIVVAINKWDIIEKDDKTMDNFRKDVMNKLSFMTYAPQVFISAKTGQRIDNVFSLIKYVHEQNSMRISTGMLNDILNDAVSKVQPPSDKGKRLKIYYMTQVATNPPTFVLFVNDRELAHFSYVRYLENRIRETFGLEGTPLRFIVRERSKDNEKG
ncbi:MAG: ribosome biogenesis GTPase Der [Clostridia bacterium]|nr:ribosome biogenesis GTPase Der [Clostridia bacterium]